MTAIWKLSSDTFDKAEKFPLPVISIGTDSSGCSVITCANAALQGMKIIESSPMWASMNNNDRLFEFTLYYMNPVSNTIIGYYLDMTGDAWCDSIHNATYDFALSSLPVIKISTITQLQPFEA